MSTMCRPKFCWFIFSGTLGKKKVLLFTLNMKLNIKSFISLKPYGDMPREMVWDKFAFIGKDKYEMKLERRDH